MSKNTNIHQKRKLKIQPFTKRTSPFPRLLKFVPQIILRGNWLENAQFCIGDEVEVFVNKDFIQIQRVRKEAQNV